MPKLPDAFSLGESRIPQPSGAVAQVTPVENSAVGQGMVSAGGELQNVAKIIDAAETRQDQMVAEDAINRLQAARIELEHADGGFRSVKGSGAVGPQFVNGFQEKFEAVKQNILGSLQSDQQRQLFNLKAPVPQLQFRSALLSHQAVETDKFNAATEDATIDLARKDLFSSPLDPNAVDAGMARVDWAIDQKGRRLGWSQEQTADVKAKYKVKLYEDMAGVLVERDPLASLGLINKKLGVGSEAQNTGIAAIDNIPADKLIELRHRAVSAVTQAENKRNAAEEQKIADAKAAYKEARDFALTGQAISPEYALQLRMTTAGTQIAPLAEDLIKASLTGAMHGSQTLPNQEAALRALDEKVAQGSSPEEVKLVQQARTITETQKAAYKENPWAAVTRFARAPQEPEQSVVDASLAPKLVADRLSRISGVETYAGRAVSPLQPNEAQAYAQALAKLPPEQRAAALSQVGVQLSAPRIQALADQLDKNDKPLALALKMGADRTTAGRAASTYVIRGAQALSDKTVKKDDQALAGWRAEIATLVRGTLGDDRAENDVIDAAYFVRAALEQEGVAPSGFKPMSASAENAVAMVIGRPLERAGVKTMMPRGMDEKTFDTKIAAYTADKLKEQAPEGVMYLRGQPVKLEVVANRLPQYGMRFVSPGRYAPIANNAPLTLDKDGRTPLILELR